MELKIRKKDNIYILDIQGKMDLYNSNKLKELAMKMFKKKVERLIINMDGVDYIESSGIGALIFICSTVKKMNIRLAFINIRGPVKEVMELTKLAGYLPVSENLRDAIKRVES